MPGCPPTRLLDISRQFQIHGEILHAEPCKVGHINETYTATYNQGGTQVRYIHQRINHHVFTNPAGVMDNLVRVTTHLRRKLAENGAKDITRRAVTVIPTNDGKSFLKTADGEYWRTFVFIERVRTYEAVETTAQAFEAGRAFGEFQSLLADLPGKRLIETIPHFLNSRRRFDALLAGIEADKVNRAASAKPEIDFARSQEPAVDVLLNALAKRKIPERITHNDTKFNNVMLDVDSQKAMCVVDLDTVMPGTPLYDFGDMVRSTTSPTLEDETDLSKVRMHMPMFKAIARGYIGTAGSFLTKNERALVAFSGRLIALTLGMRFLTDYLQGDTYFRVHRPQHNLIRCRTQFRLAQSIEQQQEAMQKFADSL